ncbi:MAG TPA: MFS transporter [Steroidobacteraceae bacterium]|nr:MFS transporter [Steroidobacteraceae bacterium]
MSDDSAANRSAVTRLLQKLSNVHADEISAAILAFFCLFSLFTGYAILRPLRDSMVLIGGIDTHSTNLSGLFGWTFAGMLMAMPIYGWLASRFARRIFLPIVYVFFILNLLGFYLALKESPDSAAVARVFYVWVSVVNLFVVSVFWSLMADTFSSEQSTRIFSFVAAGSSAGSVLGPTLTNLLVRSLGNANLLLVSVVFWALAITLMIAMLRRYGTGVGIERAQRPPERPIGGNPFAGFSLVFTSRYLLGISLFIFLLSTASTLLYLQQQSLIEAVIADKTARTQLLSRIDIVVNVLAILMQLFAVGRLTSRLGVAVMLLSVPLMMVVGFSVLALVPMLAVLIGVLIARRAGEYAVMRPCREMLFTSVPRATKYKAKNFIDTVIYRFADWMNALAHDFLVGRGATTGMIAWVGVGASAIWALVAYTLGRRHQRQELPDAAARA